MLFITDNEFERVVSRARNRDIAREYYRRDYVVNVSITTDNRGYYHISGKVMINESIKYLQNHKLNLSLDLSRGDERYKFEMGGTKHYNYRISLEL